MEANTYLELRQLRDRQMKDLSHDHIKLNQFHDSIITEVIKISVQIITDKYGPAPAPFLFFVMGSAGRFEQSIWSDQDHGIIYEETNKPAKEYFLHLGEEIANGLYLTGYEYCHGGVMASNPSWCQSRQNWQEQVTNWIDESTWESIRNLLILVDSRSIYGETEYLTQLKRFLLKSIENENLFQRIYDNTMFFQKGVGILGQLLVEEYGIHAGTFNLKEKAIFPFVNAIRFFALKENIIEAPTITRLEKLSEALLPNKENYKQQFLKLLNYRLLYVDQSNYETGHFLLIEKLTKEQKKELKEIIRTAVSLCNYARRIVEKEGKHGDE